VETLAAKIDDLKLNFTRYGEVGKRARETAWKLTWDKIREQYVKLYEELIK